MSMFKLFGGLLGSGPKLAAQADSSPAGSLPYPTLNIDLKKMVSKLDDECRHALEAAAALTMEKKQYNVEVEHWLLALLQSRQGDLCDTIKALSLNRDRLRLGLDRAIGQCRTGNTGAPALSGGIVELLREAWLVASINHGAASVSGLHVLLALLDRRDYLAKSTFDDLCAFAGTDTLTQSLDRSGGAGRSQAEIDGALQVWDELQSLAAAGKEIFAINPANRFERKRVTLPTPT